MNFQFPLSALCGLRLVTFSQIIIVKTKPRMCFRAAFEGHHRLLLGEFRGSEHAYDHFFQRKLSAVYTEQLNRQKVSAAAFAGKIEPVLGAGDLPGSAWRVFLFALFLLSRTTPQQSRTSQGLLKPGSAWLRAQASNKTIVCDSLLECGFSPFVLPLKSLTPCHIPCTKLTLSPLLQASGQHYTVARGSEVSQEDK